MEYSHVQQLTEDFKPQDTLDYKFDTLMEIAEHFCIEYNEDLKRGLEENFRSKLKSLIFEYETKITKLKNTLSTIRSY